MLPLIPVGLFLLIALLVYLPSMTRAEVPARPAWRGEPEWFGGPREGLGQPTSRRAVEDGEAAPERGGDGARW